MPGVGVVAIGATEQAARDKQNDANTGAVVELLAAAAPEGLTVENLHEGYGVIAVQGTKSDEVLEALGLPTQALGGSLSLTGTALTGTAAPGQARR